MGTETARPMRSDARRNRDALVVAATTAFTTNGADSSLEDIATAAGVGIGTLYRHFPTREALIEAVYRNEIERLCDGVDARLEEKPADQVLADWMARLVDHVATKKGMAVALRSASGTSSELFAYAHTKLYETLDRMLAAGVAAGTVRSDVDAKDLLKAVSGMCQTTDQREQALRLVALLMDGLRYSATAAAPV